MIEFKYIVSSLVYSGIGIVVLIVGFLLIDLIAPPKLWQEIVKQKNTPLAIVIASFILGISIIIASAIH